MATVSNSDYKITIHMSGVKLSELTKCVIKPNGSTGIPIDIFKIDLNNLSYDKNDNQLEFNRLVSNYTGTLYYNKEYGIDFNKLLPSDLELFSTNSIKGSSDDDLKIGDYSNYLRAVYINDGNNDILKIQLIGLGEYFEPEIKIYKNDTLVYTITYYDNKTRSHLLTFTSQNEIDTISCKLHEREDNSYELTEIESKEFSSGKGRYHQKVSDCNISYIISDSTKNILSKTYINNHNNYLVKPSTRIVNTSAITKKNKKIFFGVPF